MTGCTLVGGYRCWTLDPVTQQSVRVSCSTCIKFEGRRAGPGDVVGEVALQDDPSSTFIGGALVRTLAASGVFACSVRVGSALCCLNFADGWCCTRCRAGLRLAMSGLYQVPATRF